MKAPQVVKFVRTTASVLNRAVDQGISKRKASDLLTERLKESCLVFSGLKTFHQLGEAFPSLTDEKGERKPFEQFLNDVRSIDENYNKYYLKAEYNFAVSSSQMAAKWEEFASKGDRYDLQYRTAGDSKVRESHRKLNRVTFPIDSPFWDQYFPPNGWGCRCNVVQVREGKYPVSDEKKAMQDGNQSTTGKHQEMFRFNPGKQQAAFPAYNPYTIKKCEGCSKNGYKLSKNVDNELCAGCDVIRGMFKIKKR